MIVGHLMMVVRYYIFLKQCAERLHPKTAAGVGQLPGDEEYTAAAAGRRREKREPAVFWA